jgi:outer membrane protein
VLLTLPITLPAAAQAPAPSAPPNAAAPAAAPEPVAPLAPSPAALSPAAPSPDASAPAEPGDPSGDIDPTLDSSNASVAADRRTGFTAGLRLGVGLPLGQAGHDLLLGSERDLKDLTPWRAPIWLDVGYSPTASTTIGVYAQVGTGGTGDACIASDCDWSDIRVGAELEWRILPGAPVNPWLGLGLGYEWLSYRALVTTDVPDGEGGTGTFTGRYTERFGGPELMLHGGIDFQVEDALRIGPYASATVGQYMTDSYSCQPATPECPSNGSLDGAGFHSWIGFGLRGAYTP